MIYIVKPGDTLAEIARSFGIPLARLVQVNENIKNINQIYIGQQIYIPEEEIRPISPPGPVEPGGRPMPLPRPVGAEYTLKRINNLLLISFANKGNYRIGETVVLYLVKINIGSTQIPLHYSTAQRFNFRAAVSNQQWDWSRGRSFAYQKADLVIAPNECKVYTANWDQQSNNGRQMRGNINITAWNIADRLNDQRLSFSINIE